MTPGSKPERSSNRSIDIIRGLVPEKLPDRARDDDEDHVGLYFTTSNVLRMVYFERKLLVRWLVIKIDGQAKGYG